MKTEKIVKGLRPEEIAEAFVLPVDLSDREKKAADKELKLKREKRRNGMTEKEKVLASLSMLKFRLEDYISSGEYNPELNFGYFLEQYLVLLDKKQNEFAKEIDIHETLLSQYLNSKREPNENMIVRLEIHSNNIFPAICWFKLVEKEREHIIKNDSTLRRRQEKHVKNRLQLSF